MSLAEKSNISHTTPKISGKTLGLVSLRYSQVTIDEQGKISEDIYKVLSERAFNVHIIIRIFGKDEVWAVASVGRLDRFEKIDKQPFVLYSALLESALDLDQRLINRISKKKLPVAYLLFRKRNLDLTNIDNYIKHYSGKAFLIGTIDHPMGYNYFAAFTQKDGSTLELSNIANKLMKQFDCTRWDCYLGVKHSWPGAEDDAQRKTKTTKQIQSIIKTPKNDS